MSIQLDNTDPTPTRLAWRAREAAKAIGISDRKLWELTKRGEVPHFRLGKKMILYPVDALQRWLDASLAQKPANQIDSEAE